MAKKKEVVTKIDIIKALINAEDNVQVLIDSRVDGEIRTIRTLRDPDTDRQIIWLIDY